MNRPSVFFVCVFLLYSIAVADSQNEIFKNNISDTALKLSYNPFLVSGASLVVPGAGQVYTKHFIKGGTFLASEAVTASFAVYWFNDSQLKKSSIKEFSKRTGFESEIDSIKAKNDIAFLKHDERFSRYRAYNAFAWASGLYVFNFLDAIDCSGIVSKSGSRSPAVAGWLSAVPGLGLGQWYNGSLSKAGMMFMGQMALGVTALNYHRLMNHARSQYDKTNSQFDQSIIDAVHSNRDTSSLSQAKMKYLEKWEFEQNSAFKTRNSFLWYSLFFYFYGILDAVVDAHLHDYPEKMRVYPDLAPQSDGALLRLNVKF